MYLYIYIYIYICGVFKCVVSLGKMKSHLLSIFAISIMSHLVSIFEIKFSVYKQANKQPTNQPTRRPTEKKSRSAQQQARLTSLAFVIPIWLLWTLKTPRNVYILSHDMSSLVMSKKKTHQFLCFLRFFSCFEQKRSLVTSFVAWWWQRDHLYK